MGSDLLVKEKVQNENISSYNQDYTKSRFFAIVEGTTARIIFNFTSGAFLAGFLSYMGADDTTCGQVAAIPVLAAVIQFVSPMFLEKLENRKSIVTLFCFIHRILLFFMLFIPILPFNFTTKILTAVILYFISYLLVSFVTPAASNWIVSLVPQNIRGKYFGFRESNIILFSSVLNIIMGKVLDSYKESGNIYFGYIILFLVIFVTALLNLASFINMKEPVVRKKSSKTSFKDIMIPLRDIQFRKIIIMFFIWGVGLNIGAPYFGVYMVSKLKLNYTFISLNGMIFSLVYLFAAGMWGKLADRRKWTFVCMLSTGMLFISHSIWFFINKDSNIMILLTLVAHITGGIAWAGINISLFNIQFDFSPDEGRTIYLGFNAALSGIVGFLAAMFASYFIGKVEYINIYILNIKLVSMQFFMGLSGIIVGLVSLYILFFIQKEAKN